MGIYKTSESPNHEVLNPRKFQNVFVLDREDQGASFKPNSDFFFVNLPPKPRNLAHPLLRVREVNGHRPHAVRLLLHSALEKVGPWPCRSTGACTSKARARRGNMLINKWAL